ncbi:MAG: ABC transporter ATP-binding protein [Alphaproteobacteria bacterium]|nr:ABC transporter ATP-binding protein [Alphaproteobacteria bacterium]
MNTSAEPSGAATGDVRLREVVVRYGERLILDRVSLDVRPGEFVCLLGPSGCGKTTTLRAIAGLVAVTSGEIVVNGRRANDIPPHQRGTSMVFQDLALFPHMTVAENIAFGLTLRHMDKSAIADKVSAMVELLRLGGLEDRFPKQLSGGQQQRVALARSLVVDPAVILLDEPFASLDRKLREEMRHEIRALQRKVRITALFVTHDQEEALTMADTVVVMNHGRLEQVGSPTEVYETPASRFVLSFVGYSNFLRAAEISADRTSCRVAGQPITVRSTPLLGEGGATALAIRPERVRIAGSETELSLPNRLPATVRDARYEGATISYDVALADGQTVMARVQLRDDDRDARGQGTERFRPGQTVVIAWGARDACFTG